MRIEVPVLSTGAMGRVALDKELRVEEPDATSFLRRWPHKALVAEVRGSWQGVDSGGVSFIVAQSAVKYVQLANIPRGAKRLVQRASERC